MSLIPVDTSSEIAVSSYLEQARDWLAKAVDETGPEQIAAAKAEIATAAEATKQLGLSKEIQLDAQEMVRRAEYALGKAIRKGQEEGTVRRNGQRPTFHTEGKVVSPYDFASKIELHGNSTKGQPGILALAAADAADIDDAIDEAKAEGNLSRANVVRKVNGIASGETRDARARKVADLAQQGHTSQQISSAVGIGREAVKQIAKDYGIHIPADHAVGKRQRLNSNRILSGVVDSLEVAAISLQQVNPLDLDQDNAQEWVDSLTESLAALRKAANSIKESLHV